MLGLGAVILLIAKLMPGVYIESFGTAVLVAILYSLINITLGTLLKVLGLPFVILTLGAFLIVINTLLLWLTDKLIESFEIKTLGTTFIVALLITFSDTVFTVIF